MMTSFYDGKDKTINQETVDFLVVECLAMDEVITMLENKVRAE